ncbi:hypothetical protein LTR94_026807, partial [Friedmanniomyces endolithicus]
MNFSAVVVAAGSGSRAGGNKQWRILGEKPVLRWSVEALLNAGADELVIVIQPDAEPLVQETLRGLSGWSAAEGGADRAASVQAGLAQLKCAEDHPVLIHDAARPLLPETVIRRLLEALDQADGAVPALPVSDSLRRGRDGWIDGVVDRDGLWRVQTPQAFRRGAIEAAYRGWNSDQLPTDEAVVVQTAGGKVAMIAGDDRLMKLTYPEDFAMAAALLAFPVAYRTHIGSGYDVHRWGPGGAVWLCGVELPHNQTLIGHSDADAGLHALTDALLGAIAQGDIGDHFPPSDPQWRGASSDKFLVHAADLVARRGGRIVNVDVTLICERPKVKPHRQAMRERIAALLGLGLDQVSVKATTTE